MSSESIFSLSEEFGIESPFGNWLEEKQVKVPAKILDIRALKQYTLPSASIFGSTKKKTEKGYIAPITVYVDVSSEVSRVVVSVEGKSKTASRNRNSSLNYFVNFELEVPPSFVRIDGYNTKKFEFKVTITDRYTYETHTKYLKATISTEGEVSNSKTQTENERYLDCNYSIKNDFLVGGNVTTSRSDSKVKAGGTLKKVKAIVLHRTVGYSIAGAIGHSKGTHFYVEGSRKGKDGEIFQSMSLKKSSNHIFDTTDRIANKDVKTDNSIGIEVIGMAYSKEGGKYYTKTSSKTEIDPKKTPITKGYTDKNNKTTYWDKLTEAQVKSVTCLVKLLMDEYSIPANMILVHEDIQKKTAGEGQAVKDAIFNYIIEE